MIVIPALGVVAQTPASAVRETLAQWEWFGFHRLRIALPAPTGPASLRRELEDLIRETHVPIQVEGDFSTSDQIADALDAGAESVVLGARALDEPDWLRGVAGQFANQLLVRAPARERRVRSRGAVRTLPVDLHDQMSELVGEPIAGFEISFDAEHEFSHSDLALVEDLVEDGALPIFVSGGVASLSDLRDLEFRGVSAAVLPAEHLSAIFDEQMLARSFSD